MKRTLIIVVPVLLAACSSDEVAQAVPEATRVHTVNEFLAHPELRMKFSAVCSNDPGRTGLDANCINARRADRVAAFGSAASMPRMLP